MTQASETSFQKSDTDEVRQQLKGKHVCPFCGVIRGDQAQPCPRCTMEDTLATRQGTRQRIGPWYVMQARNPSAPGMKFTTLISLVKKGHVTPRSIVRGPTTYQLWTFAAKVRGLSRELGLCHHCGDAVESTSTTCAACGRIQEPPADPDQLMENHSGLPELTLSTSTNPETNLDSGSVIDTGMGEIANLSGLTLSKTGRPAIPSISQQPTGSRPAQPINARAEEAILSARELAAAFQLDFKPKKPVSITTRVAQQAQTPEAPAKPVSTPAPILEKDNEPRSGWGKWVVLLLFLALIASGVMVLINPDWQDKIKKAWETAKTKIDKPAIKPTGTTTPVQIAPAIKPVQTSKVEKPEVRPITPSQPVITKPATAPDDSGAPKIEPVVEKKPEPKPVQLPPPPAPPKVEVKKPVVEESFDDSKLTLDQATVLAKQLRNDAIDLEADAKWNQALNVYLRIQKLPPDAWPADLSRRLAQAQSKVK